MPYYRVMEYLQTFIRTWAIGAAIVVLGLAALAVLTHFPTLMNIAVWLLAVAAPIAVVITLNWEFGLRR